MMSGVTFDGNSEPRVVITALPSKAFYVIFDTDNVEDTIASREWWNVRGEGRKITDAESKELRSSLYERLQGRATNLDLDLPPKNRIFLVEWTARNVENWYIEHGSKTYQFPDDDKHYAIASVKKIIDHMSDPFNVLVEQVSRKWTETGNQPNLVTFDGNSEPNFPPPVPPTKVPKLDIVQLPSESKAYYAIIGDRDFSEGRIANREWVDNVRGPKRDITKGKTDEQIAAEVELLRSDLFDRVKARAPEGVSVPSKDEIALIARSHKNDSKGYIKAHSKFYKFDKDEKFYGIASDKKITDHIKTLKPAGKNSGYLPTPVADRKRHAELSTVSITPSCQQPPRKVPKLDIVQLPSKANYLIIGDKDNSPKRIANEEWRNVRGEQRDITEGKTDEQIAADIELLRSDLFDRVKARAAEGESLPSKDEIALVAWTDPNIEKRYIKAHSKFYKFNNDEKFYGIASDKKVIDHIKTLKPAGKNSGYKPFKGSLPVVLEKARKKLGTWRGNDSLKRQVSRPFEQLLDLYETSFLNETAPSKLCEKIQAAHVKVLNESFREMKKTYADMPHGPQGGNLVNREERDVNDEHPKTMTRTSTSANKLESGGYSFGDGSFADIKVIHECGQPKVHSGTIKSLEKEHRIEQEKRARDGVEKSEMKRLRLEAHPDLPEGIDNPREHKNAGQAIVYRGTMAGKDVAVKVFTKESDWEACKKEVQLLMRLPRHPNVVEVLDFYEEPKPSFVMRFIPGGSLRERLDKHGRFVGSEAIRLLKGIGEGLHHLHAHGIVHRDVKTPNIMLEELGGCLQPVLIDLGVGKRLENSDSVYVTSTLKGTLRWIAPEMIEDCMWSKKTDMYALGIVMWEVLTGHMPYAECFEYQINEYRILRYVMANGRPDVSGMTDVSPACIDIMTMLWHQEPEMRPSAEGFLRWILELSGA